MVVLQKLVMTVEFTLPPQNIMDSLPSPTPLQYTHMVLL
jgi:hypothetical protein